ncbi:hypothetical protein [Novosphingobium aquimarinum]|uniref:hypothetical protein n=1 Tax=Novosphingobium aquimarinum TaxID=2682494 RepID=UPI0012EBD5B8|nr:hypothetical protein [Novosphingobium aquimarinum]
MTGNPAFAQTDAAWHAHRYVPDTDSIQFRLVPRALRSSVPFLTEECLGSEAQRVEVPRSGLEGAFTSGTASGLHFLFHSAFCSSTMLAHALDRPGRTASLSEPVILNDVVGFRRRGARPEAVEGVARTALRLLARPYPGEQGIVVKPSNIVNPLIPALLAMVPEARAILLYAPLEDFLASVAKKGLWCRLWVRELLRGYLTDGFGNLGFGPEELFLQSDLQIAAVGWLAQQQAFGKLLETQPGRLRSLASSHLIEEPAEVIAASIAHYGFDAAESEASGAIGRDSKTGGAFDAAAFQTQREAVRTAHGDELEKVSQWATHIAGTFSIPLELPRPLLP